MKNVEFLDNYERTLEEGLLKVCRSEGFADEMILKSDDIEEVWEKRYIKEYVADATENFVGYPLVAIAWAGYLGMGVAKRWDEDWAAHCKDPYRKYYGPRGFDDMDENVIGNILGLEIPGATGVPDSSIGAGVARKLNNLMMNLAQAAYGLMGRCGVEAQTEEGFYVLVRTYTVMYRIGANIELKRLGYRNCKLTNTGN